MVSIFIFIRCQIAQKSIGCPGISLIFNDFKQRPNQRKLIVYCLNWMQMFSKKNVPLANDNNDSKKKISHWSCCWISNSALISTFMTAMNRNFTLTQDLGQKLYSKWLSEREKKRKNERQRIRFSMWFNRNNPFTLISITLSLLIAVYP